jgi:hypothetical protein
LGWDTSQLYSNGTVSVVTTYVKGDWNRDGQMTAADIPAMLVVLVASIAVGRRLLQLEKPTGSGIAWQRCNPLSPKAK